jgi:hypothetical protein
MLDLILANPNLSRLSLAADPGSVTNERIAIILGFITLTLALTVFASCRICLMTFKRLGLSKPLESAAYQRFYSFHSYYWWLFGVFLLSHLSQALIHTGLPQAGDPDAGAHWIILGFGFCGMLTSATTFLSCRLFFRLSGMLKIRQIARSSAFLAFYRPHTYYWLLFFLLVAAHFAEAFRHAGVWPG